MSVKLTISIEEASLLLSCLGFLKSNVAIAPNLREWRLIGGKDFRITHGERCRLELLSGYISEARELAIETHPFNPFIKTF